ncbi:hypothetical protein [Nocardia sp. XZ_19_231]|uniref:hypothetical protein n=1 Tax=unclassified Nocardia TaxID=2637762 RepID=UPI00188FC38C|nr:hypothetical protein [Nocardia sp. XZ_19_231]
MTEGDVVAKIWIVASVVHYDEKVLREMPDRPGGRTLAQWREQFGGFRGSVPMPGGGTAEISLAALDGLSDHAYIDLAWITSTDGKSPTESEFVPGQYLLAEIDDESGGG